jgi:hypothetical protein
MKMKLLVRPIALLAFAALAGPARATGFYGPMFYLDEGGRNLAASPEFYWELEVKRLAGDFHPPEKLRRGGLDPDQPNEERKAGQSRVTGEADERDFAAALQAGEIKPADPAEATRQAEAARAVINRTSATSTEILPAEFPSEFADYHRGAFAYRRGPEHWEEARQAWEVLLQRPERERHYRSVWAAFMLGKIALKRNDPAAVSWFERTREMARAGFADSLGLAADSYGWQGRSEWKQDRPEKAAPLFLTQLALGDESAIVSLKALVPGREPVEGMLNYGPEPDERSRWDAEQRRAAEERAAPELERAARDPLLRRLITAHILATASVPEQFREDQARVELNRDQRWLAILQNLKLTELDDAEYIGWAAYNNGDYAGAAQWLDLARKDSPAALWLRSKLQRRAGKMAEAAMSMARAWQTLRNPELYTRWNGPIQPIDLAYLGPHWTFAQSAGGDLGALHLERSDFVQALETMLAGDLWNDAAFVAERILTTNELQTCVEQHPPDPGKGADDPWMKLRYLLGRRFVREDHYEEASKFIPSPWNLVLAKYVAALQVGHDKARPKRERAHALFTAGWLARHDGMELMGTEGAPDGFVDGGNFPMPDLARQMQFGHYEVTSYASREPQVSKRPIVLRVPAAEHLRLTKSKPSPDLRFHYRIIAGALALQAAELLPNDSEELADVLNRAGLWVKDVDEKIGNRSYQIIERRAAQTTIGRAAIARHWFVEQSGPWSQEQQSAHDALSKELNLPRDN